MKKIIAVTGSTGFVGSVLCQQLEEEGHELIRIDSSTHMNVADWQQMKQVKPFDVMIHLAAKTFVPYSYQQPHDFYQTNVMGTLNALEICRIHQARMVFASSYVYGVPDYLPIDERHSVNAFNPYAESKIIAERLCASYHKDFQLPVIILRPFNIYGPGQSSQFLLPVMMSQISTGKISLKDPDPKRDMVFIDDVVDAYLRAARYTDTNYEILNIALGQSYSVMEIASMLVSFLPETIPIEFTGEKRKEEVADSIADIEKAEKILGWKPLVTLDKGIFRCLQKNKFIRKSI